MGKYPLPLLREKLQITWQKKKSTIFSKPYKIKGQELLSLCSFCVQRTCLRSEVIFPWGRTRSFDTKCFSLLLYYRHSCLELDGGDSRRLAHERLNMQMVCGLTTYKNRTLTHNLVNNQPGKPNHILCSNWMQSRQDLVNNCQFP